MAGRSDANNPHSGEPDDELGELDNILADLQDESEKYGAGTKAKRKKPEKLVRWKKRDQYGRLIAETQQSSGGAGPSSRPKDTCPVHMVPCPDDASNYAPLQVQLQEAHKALDTQLQLLQESLEDDPLACSEGREMLTRTWDMRQTHSEEKWENARPNLLESMLSAEWTLDQSCDHCHTKRAVIRCRDCLPKHLFCSDCDLAVHRNYVLHNRDSLVEGFYKALPPTCHIVQDGSGAPEISEKACLLPIASPHNLCNCDTQDIAINAGRAIILVEINGRYDLSLPLVTCKSCLKTWTPGLKDLQSNGYWPGNVDFQTVYSTDVFHTFEEFKVSAPGLSRQAFVKMLDNRTSNFGRAGRISGDSFQRSFLEWTYCRHEKEKLLAVDHFSCPACMEDIAAISVDGNRKMYRFNRTKGTDESGYFDGAFFSKDKEVAEFVEGIRNRIRPESGRGVCGKSQWKAARETAKKSGSKVDEEGVEVAVCRHGILFKALNMFRGEIYAYPLFLQKEVSLGHNIQFFCTDIMCKYYPYLQKVCEAFPDLVPLLQMKPFLSVMHAKGHSGKCEVQWGGRNQEGAGMTVGEEVEQVNSFLSRVGLTTKYMTKSARTDMITLQARGWNMRKKSNLHEYLSQRYVKIMKRTREMEQEVEALKVELGKTEVELQQWVTDVKDWAAATPNDISPDDAPGLQRVMEGLAPSIQQKKVDKYRQTDSNKARQRIQTKIAKDKTKLSQAMDFYNRLVSAEDAVGPVDVILAAECPLWPWDKDSDVPLKEKKAVFDKVMLLRRLKEEDGILLKEMQQHWQFLCRTSRRLQEFKGMGYQSGLSMEAYEGLRCILQGQLETLKRQMREVKSAYMHVVDSSVLQLEEEESEEDLQEESDGDDSDEDEDF